MMFTQILNIISNYSRLNGSLISEYKNCLFCFVDKSIGISYTRGHKEYNYRYLNSNSYLVNKLYNKHEECIGFIPNRYVYSNMHLSQAYIFC